MASYVEGVISVKRLFSLAMVAVVLLGAGWVSTFFFGSPLVRLTMKDRALGYLTEKYPGTPFTYVSGSYDFLNRGYTALLRVSGDPEVAVRVRLHQGSVGPDDYQEQRTARHVERLLTAVVLPALPGATVRASAVLPDSDPVPQVTATISWKAPDATADSFVDLAIAVMRALEGAPAVADEIMFWCDLGDKSYALTLTGGEELSHAALLPQVARPGKW